MQWHIFFHSNCQVLCRIEFSSFCFLLSLTSGRFRRFYGPIHRFVMHKFECCLCPQSASILLPLNVESNHSIWHQIAHYSDRIWISWRSNIQCENRSFDAPHSAHLISRSSLVAPPANEILSQNLMHSPFVFGNIISRACHLFSVNSFFIRFENRILHIKNSICRSANFDQLAVCLFSSGKKEMMQQLATVTHSQLLPVFSRTDEMRSPCAATACGSVVCR